MSIFQPKRMSAGLAMCLMLFFAADAFAPPIPIPLLVIPLDSLTGAPITTAAVRATNTDNFTVVNGENFGEGIYVFPDLPEGPYSVDVSAVGFQLQTQAVFVLHAELAVLEFDLVFATIDNTISVTITLDSTNTNLITNGITVSQSGTPLVTPPPVLIGNTYRVTGIPSGTFLVSSDSLSYDIQSESIALAGGGTTPVALSATSRADLTGTVGGAVVFVGGSTAVPNARILLTHLDTGTTLSVNADVDGIFALPGVTPGPVELQAFEATASLDDPAGASIPIELEVPSGLLDPAPIVEVDDTFRPGPLNVWVDFAYGDVSLGLFTRPYTSVADAISNLDGGGMLLLKGDTSISVTTEMPTLSKPMTIQAIGGPVRIGTPPSRMKSGDEESGFISR